jgi:hypothetical protein
MLTGDDVGMEIGPMTSPRIWREWLKPRLQRDVLPHGSPGDVEQKVWQRIAELGPIGEVSLAHCQRGRSLLVLTGPEVRRPKTLTRPVTLSKNAAVRENHHLGAGRQAVGRLVARELQHDF